MRGEASELLRECLAIRAKREPEAWTTCQTRLLLGSSLITTVLIPPSAFAEGGAANGRALAYLAHALLFVNNFYWAGNADQRNSASRRWSSVPRG